MRAWCVLVPKEKGEEVRQLLAERGYLLKGLRVRREGDRLRIPTAQRVDIGYPVEQSDFAEGFSPVRSYKEVVRVPDRLRALLPTAFDVIGDVALLKVPEELIPHRKEIGRAILAWNARLKVVAQDRGVAGNRRLRRIEVIAGETRTTTVHREFGLRYEVDVARAYFSPRLGTERKRVADQVGDGETVIDPFAGVGPYSILIARRRKPAKVLASDANPDAVSLLRANVAANHADRVAVREADARAALKSSSNADRVILDLPHTALEFLPEAIRALGSRGTVHLYGILDQADREDRAREIRYLVEREDRGLEDLRLHNVRAYSPTQHHVAFDVTVRPR